MIDITNADRSIWAEAALAAFIDQTGPDDGASAIADLIADLGHYCDEHDLDFLAVVARGIGHWHVERRPSSDDPLGYMPDVAIAINGGAP